MKNKNLTVTIFAYILILVLFSITLIGFFWIKDAHDKSENAATELIDVQIENTKSELKSTIISLVNYIEYQRLHAEDLLRKDIKEKTYEAYEIISSIYENNKETLSDDAIKKLIVDALRNVRFNDGRGYYFIDELTGKVILYPVLPESEGQNLYALQDDRGNYTLQEEIELVTTQGEGYIEGYWINPNNDNDDTVKKITYVKAFEPYNWYFGCGEYLDDVEKDIQAEILDYFNMLSYGENNDQYIFVHDFEGIELANSAHPDWVGTSNFNLRDIKGTYIVQEQIKIVRTSENGGFLTLYWEDDNEVAEKLTYVHRVIDWNWVIGTGQTISNVQEIVEDKKLILEKDEKRQLISIGMVLFAALILGVLIARALVTVIKHNMRDFLDVVEDATDKLEIIKPERIAYNDFKEVVNVTNHMTDKINDLLQYDELTSLYNRKFIIEKLDQLHIHCIEKDEFLSLILIDVDDFKEINLRYNENSGDRVLKVISAYLVKSVRDNDFVARYGGDAFLIVLPNTGETVAFEIAERIRRTIEQKIIEPLNHPVTVSGGVVTGQTEMIKKLLKVADIRLMKSKKQGKNRMTDK